VLSTIYVLDFLLAQCAALVYLFDRQFQLVAHERKKSVYNFTALSWNSDAGGTGVASA
jgi:hypothetical protein